MSYKIIYKNGISFISNAETLIEAKREAIELAGYGFGSICIIDAEDVDSSNDPIAVKFEHGDEWLEP